MPTSAKALDTQTKHLTQAEREARMTAEAGVIPDRGREADLQQPPTHLIGRARTYWQSLVKRLDGLAILDDLDREMLAVYCSQLARRDKLAALLDKLLTDAAKHDRKALAPEETDKLDSLASKLASLERSLIQYADKLGFTPQGRVRLAQKRANAMMDGDPDADLFGDA
jgi:P27 family predicted phage terminase small subunit